jgi:tetraacyldisaccharide 4'-kinase
MIEEKRGILKKLYDMINPYSWITATRNRLFDCNLIKSHQPSIPTICIGNITVGGTGKTPHTEYLIKLLKDKYKTAVLSRGYGRKSKGYILADNSTPANRIGDEPYQIKTKFKDIDVAVCEKRVFGIERIISDLKEIGILLLDDAFQHRYVKAGLNILLIDSLRPIWQDCILPFGRMRESINGIKRADIVIITKCENLTAEQKESCISFVKEIFYANCNRI